MAFQLMRGMEQIHLFAVQNRSQKLDFTGLDPGQRQTHCGLRQRAQF